MRRRNGFSLLEAMLTMVVVFLVLGVGVDMFIEYSNALKFSSAKSTALGSMQTALQSMLDDARQSIQIETPPAGGQSPDLKMLMIDPTRSDDCGRPQDVIEVHYYMSTGANFPTTSLLRDSTPVGGSTTTLEVAQSVGGLNVTSQASWPLQSAGGPNAVEIQLSLQEASQVLVITGSSLRPPL